MRGLFHDGSEGGVVDEIHEEKGLENSVGELRSLPEQFCRS